MEPGFSTADKVSDVSGRGVGMDVVRKNIEKLRGKIEISSEAGKFTEIIMKIPLTMAIMDGMTVRVGQNMFSIPTTDILEFFKAENRHATRTDSNGGSVICLRDEIIPVIKLHELFRIETSKTNISDGIMAVVHNNGSKACLLIDEIVGAQQIVIKNLSDYLGGVRGIAGCSVMGDGTVSLIVDTGGLLKACLQ